MGMSGTYNFAFFQSYLFSSGINSICTSHAMETLVVDITEVELIFKKLLETVILDYYIARKW